MGGKISIVDFYDFDDYDNYNDDDYDDYNDHIDNEDNIGNNFNRVVATDGRQNDTTRVNITVININDWDPRSY